MRAQASGEAASLFDALRARCQVSTAPERVENLLRYSSELEELAERARSRTILIESQTYQYLGLLQTGQVARAGELLAKLASPVAPHGVDEGEVLRHHLVARHEFYAGRLDRALELYTEARSCARMSRMTLGDFHYTTGAAHVHLERGTLDAFWPELQRVVRFWKHHSSTLNAQITALLATRGRLDEARAHLERLSREDLAQRPLRPGQIGILCYAAAAASALGDRARCELLYRELTPFAERNAVDLVWFCFGSVAHFLGPLARALGDMNAAAAHLETAVQRNAACDFRTYAAHSRFELARTPAPAVQERRASLIDEAEDDAHEFDLRALLAGIGRARTELSLHSRANPARNRLHT